MNGKDTLSCGSCGNTLVSKNNDTICKDCKKET